jgi:hypothetical protein
MTAPSPEQLIVRFVDAVRDVVISTEDKAEVVINLAKASGIDDMLLKQVLQRELGPEASDHPYFHWQPRARFDVGAWVRVVDGAPQALGRRGRVSGVENPRKHGVRGMSRGFFFTVVLEDSPDPWGFREEQLEPSEPSKR